MQAPPSSPVDGLRGAPTKSGQTGALILTQGPVDPGDAMMEVDEDGSRLPPPAVDGHNLSTSADSKTTDDEYRQFFQQIRDLQHMNKNSMWQLPISPAELNTPHQQERFAHCRFARFYSKCCSVISSSWHCDVEVCLPEELRKSTLFSMALLLKLRQLANKTKDRLSETQELLVQFRDRRIAGISGLQDPHFDTQQAGNSAQCEDFITENVFGLTMVDVFNAIQVNRPTKGGKKARWKRNLKLQGFSIPTPQQQSQIADRVVNRRRRPVATVSAALESLTVHPDPEPVVSHIGRPKPPPREDVPTIPAEARAAFEAEYWAKRARGELTTQNKKFNLGGEAAGLGSLLTQARIRDDTRALSKKRQKQLAAGGLSRKSQQSSVRMPSERYDLNSVPTLHAKGAATSPEALAKLGQLPLPD